MMFMMDGIAVNDNINMEKFADSNLSEFVPELCNAYGTKRESENPNMIQDWYKKLCRYDECGGEKRNINKHVSNPIDTTQRLHLQRQLQLEYQHRLEFQKNCRQKWWRNHSATNELNYLKSTVFNSPINSHQHKQNYISPFSCMPVKQELSSHNYTLPYWQPTPNITCNRRSSITTPYNQTNYHHHVDSNMANYCKVPYFTGQLQQTGSINCEFENLRNDSSSDVKTSLDDISAQIHYRHRNAYIVEQDQQKQISRALKVQQEVAEKVSENQKCGQDKKKELLPKTSEDLSYKFNKLLYAFQQLFSNDVQHKSKQKSWQEQLIIYKLMLMANKEENSAQVYHFAKRLFYLLSQNEKSSSHHLPLNNSSNRVHKTWSAEDGSCMSTQLKNVSKDSLQVPNYKSQIPNNSIPQVFTKTSQNVLDLNQGNKHFLDPNNSHDTMSNDDFKKVDAKFRLNSTPCKQSQYEDDIDEYFDDVFITPSENNQELLEENMTSDVHMNTSKTETENVSVCAEENVAMVLVKNKANGNVDGSGVTQHFQQPLRRRRQRGQHRYQNTQKHSMFQTCMTSTNMPRNSTLYINSDDTKNSSSLGYKTKKHILPKTYVKLHHTSTQTSKNSSDEYQDEGNTPYTVERNSLTKVNKINTTSSNDPGSYPNLHMEDEKCKDKLYKYAIHHREGLDKGKHLKVDQSELNKGEHLSDKALNASIYTNKSKGNSCQTSGTQVTLTQSHFNKKVIYASTVNLPGAKKRSPRCRNQLIDVKTSNVYPTSENYEAKHSSHLCKSANEGTAVYKNTSFNVEHISLNESMTINSTRKSEEKTQRSTPNISRSSGVQEKRYSGNPQQGTEQKTLNEGISTPIFCPEPSTTLRIGSLSENDGKNPVKSRLDTPRRFQCNGRSNGKIFSKKFSVIEESNATSNSQVKILGKSHEPNSEMLQQRCKKIDQENRNTLENNASNNATYSNNASFYNEQHNKCLLNTFGHEHKNNANVVVNKLSDNIITGCKVIINTPLNSDVECKVASSFAKEALDSLQSYSDMTFHSTSTLSSLQHELKEQKSNGILSGRMIQNSYSCDKHNFTTIDTQPFKYHTSDMSCQSLPQDFCGSSKLEGEPEAELQHVLNVLANLKSQDLDFDDESCKSPTACFTDDQFMSLLYEDKCYDKSSVSSHCVTLGEHLPAKTSQHVLLNHQPSTRNAQSESIKSDQKENIPDQSTPGTTHQSSPNENLLPGIVDQSSIVSRKISLEQLDNHIVAKMCTGDISTENMHPVISYHNVDSPLFVMSDDVNCQGISKCDLSEYNTVNADISINAYDYSNYKSSYVSSPTVYNSPFICQSVSGKLQHQNETLNIVSLSSQLHYTDHDCDQDGPEVNRDQSALMRYASAQSFPPPTADTCVTDGNIMVLRPDYIVPDFNVTSPLFRHMEEQVDEFVVEALGVGVFEARCHSMLGFVEPVSRFVDCCPSEVDVDVLAFDNSAISQEGEQGVTSVALDRPETDIAQQAMQCILGAGGHDAEAYATMYHFSPLNDHPGMDWCLEIVHFLPTHVNTCCGTETDFPDFGGCGDGNNCEFVSDSNETLPASQVLLSPLIYVNENVQKRNSQITSLSDMLTASGII